MEFRVLGPVEVRANGQTIALGRPQQRLVLAVLLAEAGRPVSTETLIDRVWDAAPGGARRTLQVHITRLRRLLTQIASTANAGAPLVHRSGGYLLDIDPGEVDVHRFRRLVAHARDPNRTDADRVAKVREAIGLWRGEPLAGLPAGQWTVATRAAWQQEYLDAAVLWAQAEHRVGSCAAVIGTLTEPADRYPLTETLTLELMRALRCVGRAAVFIGESV